MSSQQPQANDPFALLKDEHDGFRALIERWSQTMEPSVRRQIILDLNASIVSHASTEEQYLHGLYKQYLPAEVGGRYFDESLEADNKIREVRLKYSNQTY